MEQDGKKIPGNSTNDSNGQSGWPEDIVTPLEGNPDDKVELVDRASSVDADELYSYKPSAADVPVKNRYATGDLRTGDVRTGDLSGDLRTGDLDRSKSKLVLPKPEEQKTGPLGQFNSSALPSPIPKTLFDERPAVKQERRKWTTLAVLMALLLVGYFVIGREKVAPPVPTGSIFVTSKPQGAAIYMDNVNTQQVTPHEFSGIELSKPVKITVKSQGFASFPKEEVVQISALTKKEVSSFTLKSVRTLKLQTIPEGADVKLDGKAVPGITPLMLSDLVVGESVAITVEKADHLPFKKKLHVTQDMDEVLKFTLEKAVSINVMTEPGGARVFYEREGDRRDAHLRPASTEQRAICTQSRKTWFQNLGKEIQT